MTHLLLLHGAGLGSWIWDHVIPHLDAPSDAIDLPRRDASLQSAVHFITQQSQRSILVAHSFAAMFACAAATAHPETFAGIVAVGGVVPKSGRSFLSLLPPPARFFLRIIIARSQDGVVLPKKLVASQYCNDLDEACTELVLSRVQPEAPRFYTDDVEWALPEEMPRAYVRLLEDRSVNPKMQDRVIERIGAQPIEDLPTGHLPMLAQPRALADVLNRYTRSSG